jgi:hypothetical protein
MVKDLFAKALMLPDNELLVASYEITKSNIGKIQLSNSVRLLDEKTKKELRRVLLFVEKFGTGYYHIPCQNSKPNG